MKINTQKLLAGLFMIVAFASCSRPVAYVQPTTREHFSRVVHNVTPTQTPAPIVTESLTLAEALAPVATTPAEQVAQAETAWEQVDAMVRNDSKLAADKTLQKRLNRIRTLMTVTSAKTSLAPSETNSVKKMNLMERMLVKKMNKKISKQLAPANPEKAMAIKGALVIGAILVLLGLVLAFAATGTASSIGWIAAAVGLVFLLIGLL